MTTWLIYSRDLSVRLHRWTLVFALPAIDMLALALIWRPAPASGRSLTIFSSAMAVTGVGAIIVGVLVSRWYAEELALEAKNFELIALGYNPDSANR